jgi:hypothetical protein
MRDMILAALLSTALLTGYASAEPVTYTAFSIADGALGNVSFHNARVYLKFKGDTSNVQLTKIMDVNVAIIVTGVADVTIARGNDKVHATFKPNQIIVGLDQDNGGVGFGSFSPDGKLHPAYPLGIEDGTIDEATGDRGSAPSPAVTALSIDLMHDVGFSGRAWICTDFAEGNTCPTPAYALRTDKGDFYLLQKYRRADLGNPLQAGWFVATVGAVPAVPPFDDAD